MLNQISIMGRLTRDPELRYTASNTPVASFTLAVERDVKQNGERMTDFIPCVAWSGTGEFVSKYFQKGSMAVVTGRLQMRDWTDRDGNKRTAAEVIVQSAYFGESKRAETSRKLDELEEKIGEINKPQEPDGAFQELDDADGELPF